MNKKDKLVIKQTEIKQDTTYTIALAGNPNVGKSTIFNNLTGMHQHTGNWTGKTVANATGGFEYKGKQYKIVDIPGTYSIMSHSKEEEIARNYICFENPDCTIVVVDATSLERNLNLVLQIIEITDNLIICVNLLDEAKKKKIKINLEALSSILKVPVVGVIARKKKTLNNLLRVVKNICEKKKECSYIMKYDEPIEKVICELKEIIIKQYLIEEKLARWISIKILDGDKSILKEIEEKISIDFSEKLILENQETKKSLLDIRKEMIDGLESKGISENICKEKIVSTIVKNAEEIGKQVCTFENKNYANRDRKIDKILTSKKYGIPIMIMFLLIIFWITIVGANYPSQFLFYIFGIIQEKLVEFATYIHCPEWLSNMLILGMYQTLTWVISVMLPPMAIFFPLFTMLEDLGYLPRIAFNMDGFFKKACCSR